MLRLIWRVILPATASCAFSDIVLGKICSTDYNYNVNAGEAASQNCTQGKTHVNQNYSEYCHCWPTWSGKSQEAFNQVRDLSPFSIEGAIPSCLVVKESCLHKHVIPDSKVQGISVNFIETCKNGVFDAKAIISWKQPDKVYGLTGYQVKVIGEHNSDVCGHYFVPPITPLPVANFAETYFTAEKLISHLSKTSTAILKQRKNEGSCTMPVSESSAVSIITSTAPKLTSSTGILRSFTLPEDAVSPVKQTNFLSISINTSTAPKLTSSTAILRSSALPEDTVSQVKQTNFQSHRNTGSSSHLVYALPTAVACTVGFLVGVTIVLYLHRKRCFATKKNSCSDQAEHFPAIPSSDNPSVSLQPPALGTDSIVLTTPGEGEAHDHQHPEEAKVKIRGDPNTLLPHSIKPVRVYISYARYSTDHTHRVAAFASWLGSSGIAPVCDIFCQTEVSRNAPAFIEDNINNVNFVILICSPIYFRCWQGFNNHSTTKLFAQQHCPSDLELTAYEIFLIRNILFQNKKEPVVVPVELAVRSKDNAEILSEDNLTALPVALQGCRVYKVGSMANASDQCNLLYRLHTKPLYETSALRGREMITSEA